MPWGQFFTYLLQIVTVVGVGLFLGMIVVGFVLAMRKNR